MLITRKINVNTAKLQGESRLFQGITMLFDGLFMQNLVFTDALLT